MLPASKLTTIKPALTRITASRTPLHGWPEALSSETGLDNVPTRSESTEGEIQNGRPTPDSLPGTNIVMVDHL